MKKIKRNTHSREPGFTLIELLVVISVIALLLSIMMPALAKAKEAARRAVCASYLHQFAIIATAYSQDYYGFLPSFPAPGAAHAHDVSEEFLLYLEEDHSLEHEKLFCPSLSVETLEKSLAFHKGTGLWRVFGYNYWVPRPANSGEEVPPAENSSKFTILDTKQFRAPRSTSSSSGRKNPIMTDQAGTSMAEPLDSHIGKDRGIANHNSCHKWNDVLDVSNQAFIDGHVEKVKGKELEIRYGYGSGNSGRWIWR